MFFGYIKHRWLLVMGEGWIAWLFWEFTTLGLPNVIIQLISIVFRGCTHMSSRNCTLVIALWLDNHSDHSCKQCPQSHFSMDKASHRQKVQNKWELWSLWPITTIMHANTWCDEQLDLLFPSHTHKPWWKGEIGELATHLSQLCSTVFCPYMITVSQYTRS